MLRNIIAETIGVPRAAAEHLVDTIPQEVAWDITQASPDEARRLVREVFAPAAKATKPEPEETPEPQHAIEEMSYSIDVSEMDT